MIDHETIDVTTLAAVIDQLGPVAVMASVRDDAGEIVDFRYDLVNPAFCQTLNEPPDVLLGSGLLELYPSHVELGLFDAFCRVVETGEPFISELPWFDERNLQAFLEVRVTKFRDGYLMTGRDITEAKLGDHVRDIFDASNDGIIGIDMDLRVSSWNAGAERLYGYAPADVIGEHISIIAPEHLQEEQRVLLERAMGSRSVSPPFRTIRRHRDGSLADVEIAVGPIRAGDGTVIGASLIHRELTSRLTGPGREVEVWCKFTSAWVPGFRIERTQPDGSVVVRRDTDRKALPRAISRDAVRPPQQPTHRRR